MRRVGGAKRLGRLGRHLDAIGRGLLGLASLADRLEVGLIGLILLLAERLARGVLRLDGLLGALDNLVLEGPGAVEDGGHRILLAQPGGFADLNDAFLVGRVREHGGELLFRFRCVHFGVWF